jgi:outer membrane receptor protein involved in Fe transport
MRRAIPIRTCAMQRAMDLHGRRTLQRHAVQHLDNNDPNGFKYTGTSSFFVTDVRVRYRLTPQATASIGVDNLNNEKYWAFRPYTQRAFSAEVGFDF